MKRLLLGLAILSAPALVAAQQIPAPSPEALLQMANDFQQELSGNILPFWQKALPNPATQGFYGALDAQGKPDSRAAPSSSLTSEILWAFSAAAGEDTREDYKKAANYAFAALEKFRDEKYGGVYGSLDTQGNPDHHKQVYGQALALLAYGEYARFHKPALEQAKAIYTLLEKHARDQTHGGYYQTLTREWSRGKATDSATKTLKTQLMVLQAYSRLLSLWPDARLKQSHRALMEVVQSRLYDRKSGHFGVNFSDDWKVQHPAVSNGLDQQAGWSLVVAARVQDDDALIQQTSDLAVKLAALGLKSLDGTGGLVNSPSDSHKDWWVQGEAIISLLGAYQVTGDTQYLMGAMQVWGFVKAHLVHPEGDWYWGTDTPGKQRIEPRANQFKGPLHNSRAMLEAANRLQLLGALAKPVH